MKLSFTLSLALLLPCASQATPLTSATVLDSAAIDSHLRFSPGLTSPVGVARTRPATLSPGVFRQNIDHFGQLPGQTFGQRYWVDSQFAGARADAPVLFHICGEGNAETGYFLDDNATQWAKSLGARVVYIEHRYYGQSLPFADLSTAHLSYLTLDNVVEDLAALQKSLSAQNAWTGKWISIGGSYSGTLSAIYRMKHPELVVGALASSAPMISGIGQAVGTQSDVDDMSSITANDSSDRQWVYQSCTTFGFWQADGADINSNLDNPSPWLCQQLFGSTPLADSSFYNQNYEFPFIANSNAAPSHILFTYGSDDVWTNIGLNVAQNANNHINILTIDGGGHHYDLNRPTPSDSPEVINARNQFLTLAKSWLN